MARRRMLATTVVALLALVGCPDESKTKSGPQAKPAKTQPSKKASKGDSDGGKDGDGQNGGANNGGTENGGGEGGDLPEWEVIDKAHAEHQHFTPQLRPLMSWPDPRSLKPAKLPDEPRAQTRTKNLIQLVQLVVHERLRPPKPKEALLLDERGVLYMRLGRYKSDGTATLERKGSNKYPVFSMVVKDKAAGAQTLATLHARLKRVVRPKLAAEAKGVLPDGRPRLRIPPWFKSTKKIYALGALDRQGAFGIQFPWIYTYGTPTHLIVHLQEVPHMKTDRRPR